MADRHSGIKAALNGLRGELRFDEPLAPRTTFRIGGPADVLVVAASAADIVLARTVAARFDLSLFVLGAGSNLLVADEGFRGMVLTLGDPFQTIEVAGDRVTTGGAACLSAVVDAAQDSSLAGIEFLAGIPAQFGGAVKSNAGAFGRSLGDVVESIQGFDRDGTAVLLDRTGLGFGYHSSKLPAEVIVTSGVLRLAPASREEIELEVARVREHRRQTQPVQPSAGCIFRNPPGERAGRLIDRAGLKGRRIGSAQVSEKHANFIVNLGGARCAEVLALIDEIKQQVKQKTGFTLDEEIIVVKGPGIDEK